eukprot:11192162-Lingulodinium_polyedra.AAC.1
MGAPGRLMRNGAKTHGACKSTSCCNAPRQQQLSEEQTNVDRLQASHRRYSLATARPRPRNASTGATAAQITPGNCNARCP